MIIRPQYDAAGDFAGFSAYIDGEFTIPQPYKALMLALRADVSEPIYIPPQRRSGDPGPRGHLA